MGRIKYGEVELEEPIETIGDEAVPVFQDSDYLYTRRTLHFRAYYNPSSTAWQGGSPAESKRDLESRLMRPRQQFVMQFDGLGGQTIEIMRVPADGETVDVANGPIPLGVNVVKVFGARCFMVEWAVQVHVNESSRFGGAASVLLSHRWKMESQLDTNHFETRTVQGRAVFRTDRLATLNLKPDDFRGYLFPVTPPGFKLEDAYVAADADGTAIDYVVMLRQQFLNIQWQHVTNINAFHTSGMVGPGLEDQAFNLAAGALDWASAQARTVETIGRAASAVEDGLKGADFGKFLSAAGMTVGVGADTARSYLAAADVWRRNVPRAVNRFVIDIWGNPLATRKGLQFLAFKVMNGRLSQLQQAFGSNMSIMVTHDLMQPHVTLNADFTAGAIQSVTGLAANNAVAVPFYNFPDVDDIIDVATKGLLTVNKPPYQHGSRGTYLGQLVAQSIQGAFDTPAAPPTPAIARDLKPPTGQAN
jgi:hypothetical protein